VIEDSRFRIEVKLCKDLTEVSDNFVTDDDLHERFGDGIYISDNIRFYTDSNLIKVELERLVSPMRIDDKIRSVTIEDDELLAAIKDQSVRDYAPDVCRRGNKLSRYVPRARPQKAPRRSDHTAIWNALYPACRDKYGTWLPHVPIRFRTAELLKLYKKAFSWKAIAKRIPQDQLRWCHMIWLKPKEYLS
jgi:hypothetical protein